MKVAVLIATFNGANFIVEQIESIISNQDFYLIDKIVVTDDGSSDNTIELIEKYEKVTVIKNKGESGPAYNFFNGLTHCTDMDYVFFCDQDDIWDNDKISKFLECSVKLSPLIPGAIYSDLHLINAEGYKLNKTFFQNESIESHWGYEVSNLFLQNCAPGCSMMINKINISKILSTYNEGVVMHDWWALLFASLYNNVIVIEQPTVSYRQHENNTIGATKKISLIDVPKLFFKSRNNLKKSIRQLHLFRDSLSNDELKLLSYNDNKRITYLCDVSESSNFNNKFKLFFNRRKYKSSFFRDALTRFMLFFI